MSVTTKVAGRSERPSLLVAQRSLSEVGEIMGLKTKQVWWIEQCALKKLRKRLAHLEERVA
jgi:DNA-directed RNA polymerase sigma subunit (sigma70/sigma32)